MAVPLGPRGMEPPLLVIVSGAPGSGKTTLARRLGELLGFPVIMKDEIKEALFETIGTSDTEASGALGAAAFGLLYRVAGRLLDANVSTIVEGNFWRGIAETELAPLLCGARAVLLHCGGDPETILRRYRDRAERGERHSGHQDLNVLPRLREQLAAGHFQPLDLNVPALHVDTTTAAGYDPPFSEIVRFVEQRIAQ